MIALLVNGEPTLIDTLQNVNNRIKEIKEYNPSADFEKREPCRCGSCGSAYFDYIEAATCPCHDNY
jgi:hypothetical protein